MFRRLAALLWGFSLFVPVWAGAEGDPPFPPHVFHAKYLAQTHVPEPAPGVTTSCSSCQGGSNRLAFGEKGIVFHRIHLDSSVEKWTDMLLRGDAGFAKPWSPEHEYALFPEGIDGRGDS